MDKIPRKYVVSTLAYGGMAVIGLISMILFIFQKKWFLVLICIAIVWVAVDNFFCGCRYEKACGIKTKHYVIPPFLYRK